jgi:hypothetical protein
MGTHNLLLRLDGDAVPMAYLEIIAIDPGAIGPGRPRWFGLDDPGTRAMLSDSPALVAWVARTADIDGDRRRLAGLGHDPGRVLVGERGALRWRITVPDDGQLQLGGALPSLIQWDSPHPAHTMPASGLSLSALTLHGVPDDVAAVIRADGMAVTAAIGPALQVTLSTPHDRVEITS